MEQLRLNCHSSWLTLGCSFSCADRVLHVHTAFTPCRRHSSSPPHLLLNSYRRPAVVNFCISCAYAIVGIMLPDVDEEIHISITIIVSWES